MIALLFAAAVLTPSEVRGRELYLHGKSAAGHAVTAAVGDTTIEAPMPCASCHGADGRGRTEGGVRAPEITHDALAHASTLVRKRAAYDVRHLVRAITLGFDSSGNTLAAPMPRYQLMRSDAGDLVAYLRRLGTLQDPGIGDDFIRVGVVLPPRARDDARAAISAWADELNKKNGGIYARRIELQFLDGAPRGDHPFLAIGDGDGDAARWITTHDVPFLRSSGSDVTASRYIFDAAPTSAQEVRRLVAYTIAQHALPIAIAGSSPLAEVARAVPDARFTDDVAEARAVLYLDPASIAASTTPALALVPRSLMDEAFPSPPGSTIVAAGATSWEIDPSAAERYHVKAPYLVDQWNLLAAARVLEYVLRRAGRTLTRESFVNAVESAGKISTDFGPLLSFYAARHSGAPAARLFRYDRHSYILTSIE